MTHPVALNESELLSIELFRIALSPPTHKERLAAIRYFRQEVMAARLHEINKKHGPGWIRDERNRELVAWVAATAGEREDAIYEFGRVGVAYEDRYERPLNVAEHIGKLIYNSISANKFEGVQTRGGILHQATVVGKLYGISGARDKDTVRKAWRDYRGVVHLGMALDHCEEIQAPLEEVLFVAESYRKSLSGSCPRGTKKPYVDAELQISFSYESCVYGPRYLNRGLPFVVKD